jgi:hypothetical protein
VGGLKDLAAIWNLPLSVLGEFTSGSDISLKTGRGVVPFPAGSYEHFRGLGPGRGGGAP